MADLRATLLRWSAVGAIPPSRLADAMRSAGVVPSHAQWRAFLLHALTWIGMALVASAAVCFIAANWQALGRYAKFALVEGAIIVALAVAVWRGLDSLAGRVALLACAVLSGVLLALVGQVYQTGADTYELFAAWAIAILAWAILGRQPALWLLWLALVNVAVLLYFRTSAARGLGIEEMLFAPTRAWWWIFGIDATALLLWEIAAARRGGWLTERWGPRVIATAAGALVTFMFSLDILGLHRGAVAWSWLPYVLWIGALYWGYRVRTRDLYMLAGMMLSLVVVIAVALGRPLLERGGAGGFLIVGLLLLVCAAAGSYWLRQVGADPETRS